MHHHPRPTPILALVSLSLPSAAWLGCSPSATSADPPESGTISCTPETGTWPIDTYTANMSKPGESGVLKFTLVNSDPAPPQVGMNTLTVKITRSDGSPFTGTLTAPNNSDQGIFMPIHKHGSSIEDMIAPVDGSPGTYTLNSVDLFMPGYWQIRLNAFDATQATSDGDAMGPMPMLTDDAKFFFCL